MAAALSDDEILTFFQRLERSVGVNLNLSQKYLLNARLKHVSTAAAFTCIDDFVRSLNDSKSGRLHEKAYAALTTNETMFFRDPTFFQLLKQRLLPNLITRKLEKRQIRIWSAAVSTGQEIFSLAMLICLHFPDLVHWDIEIRGSDISSPVLERARQGIFKTQEMARGLLSIYADKFFKQTDGTHYQLADEIKRMVTFDRFNLISDCFPTNRYDLVLLRNVLIYFTLENKAAVLDKTWGALENHNGILVLGGTESTNGHKKFLINRDPRWNFYSKTTREPQ